jgi:hypothetical protein
MANDLKEALSKLRSVERKLDVLIEAQGLQYKLAEEKRQARGPPRPEHDRPPKLSRTLALSSSRLRPQAGPA